MFKFFYTFECKGRQFVCHPCEACTREGGGQGSKLFKAGFPRRRESSPNFLDTRFRGYDVKNTSYCLFKCDRGLDAGFAAVLAGGHQSAGFAAAGGALFFA